MNGGVKLIEPKSHNSEDIFEFWAKNEFKAQYPYMEFRKGNRKNWKAAVARRKTGLKFYRENIDSLLEEIHNLEIEDSKSNEDWTDLTIEIYNKRRELYHLRQSLEQLEKSKEDIKILFYFDDFKKIIDLFCKKAIDEVIAGNIIYFGNRLGYLYIKKSQRVNPMVDWGQSRIRKKELALKGISPKSKDNPEGENWLVFYDDPFYLRFHWEKRRGSCRIHNHTAYEFSPAFHVRQKLKEKTEENPFITEFYKSRDKQ
jgi:hypothetical protein